MPLIRLDLHTHSTCSDGTLTPAHLFEAACDCRLSALSITDHDTVAAYDDLPSSFAENILPSGDNVPVFIPGVELSAEFPQGTLHILGYGIDPFEERLRRTLDELQAHRLDRNREMTEAMEREGFQITLDELSQEAGGELIGRPHFASLMLKKGYVATYQEAFDKYLKKGAPLYMEKKRLEPEAAIRLIRGAGGRAVMAHPWQTKLDRNGIRALVEDLKNKGLEGIEAYYSQHSEEETAFCLELARRFDLFVTAGSDFHGEIKPEIPLGMTVLEEALRPFFETLQTTFSEVRP